MKLHLLDIGIILAYVMGTLWIGFWLARRAGKGIQSYFLGGNDIPWYLLGLSNASGMFDVSGTMIAVAWLFVYGLKSTWIPWLWPVWNQIFMMVFLSTWLRRSDCLTGAEWIRFRFGDQTGARLSHLIIVVFALLIVIAFMAYFVEGIGKFATQFLPWDLSIARLGLSSEDGYALLIIALTTVYTMKGGFYSVVGTEVMQFAMMTIACVVIGTIGIMSTTPAQIQAAVPENWGSLWPGWHLNLDWSDTRFPLANDRIQQDGYTAFGFIFTLMLFKGVWASLAGPVPSYDMQRVLSTRTPSEAAKMFGLTPVVLCLPRYFMIAGITVLALVYIDPVELIEMSPAQKLSFALPFDVGQYVPTAFEGMAPRCVDLEAPNMESLDFERVLPFAVSHYVPLGFKGLLLAGLLAAFMSTFAAFINAGSAYVVNDIYLRYVNPQAAPKTLVQLGYVVTVSLVVVGVAFGLLGGNIQARTDWIVGLLYGSYVAANVLKWVWWRFNAYGFFAGMLSGMLGVAIMPPVLKAAGLQLLAIEQFPLLLLISLSGCLLGCLLTRPDDDFVLKIFYRRTRPWGCWGPIRAKVLADDPSFLPNQDFGRDVVNVLVGILWQTTLVVLPVYLVLRDWRSLAISGFLLLVSTAFLKRNWWDRLGD